ncbi:MULTISPECIES: hypothetical protein [Arthrospira]|uniref:Uncharacterized protein n=1 Tax=Limnospira platensis NIES-46 TaxID=1236695 RepID=A0A5M3TF41_LIMPL|nr:hypothetical protein [Arthrospira platensis]AMW28537.1 hypothetical protein AP285_11720 [Arthrospira platensis YZ]KDR55625.1 hypothetical protein APPUASWS_021630 [Arthrospira platensis str. Paraca]MBD2668634.1 hypothetical protein [Arthrospira platensis FACHB-439]MBD2711821.1 hypothetical protein [Arthrospira platensis FACHB-835]MDF2209758.1 hypothetical protein [Arthrospira platensis NCB002]MDT9183911.1 hypothetical protein [Limnospira sp. PMC 289.06]MDT9296126.1 hypothetical protein [Ar
MATQKNNQATAGANYDRNIMSAETAARMEREGENFKKTPDAAEGTTDTTAGYRISREGLLDNFAIEPEMYVEEPGDLREQEQAEQAERVETLKEVNETDEEGKLTMSEDNRGKGTGII